MVHTCCHRKGTNRAVWCSLHILAILCCMYKHSYVFVEAVTHKGKAWARILSCKAADSSSSACDPPYRSTHTHTRTHTRIRRTCIRAPRWQQWELGSLCLPPCLWLCMAHRGSRRLKTHLCKTGG